MTPRRWRSVDGDLIITGHGVCAICPRCGRHVLLAREKGVDPCVCGTLLRVTVEAREPWEYKCADVGAIVREAV